MKIRFHLWVSCHNVYLSIVTSRAAQSVLPPSSMASQQLLLTITPVFSRDRKMLHVLFFWIWSLKKYIIKIIVPAVYFLMLWAILRSFPGIVEGNIIKVCCIFLLQNFQLWHRRHTTKCMYEWSHTSAVAYLFLIKKKKTCISLPRVTEVASKGKQSQKQFNSANGN